MNKACYEPVTREAVLMEASNRYMKVKDLRKEYPNGFRAVKDVNLKLYAD